MKKVDVLREPLKDQFENYLSMCAEIGADSDLIRRTAVATAAHNKGKIINPDDFALVKSLENQWYAAINRGSPDWTVYDGDQYLAEVWFCWATYSRKYLKMITDAVAVNGRTVREDIGRINVAVDLGCGAGYTAAALSNMFPRARVFGTNLRGTKQWKIANMLGSIYGFNLIDDIADTGTSSIDLVFASEYFEHFEKPIEHLKHALKSNPKHLLIANTFGSPSIGHFKTYRVTSSGFLQIKSAVSGSAVSKRFNSHLKYAGYRMEKTKLWNNRPMYWKKLSKNII